MNIGAVRQRVTDAIARARERWPLLDHIVRAVSYFGEVMGNQLAAGVTYFGFLSFFPLVALAFAVLGYVVEYVPGADEVVTRVLHQVLPGMVGSGPGRIDVQRIAEAKEGVGIIGLLGLLYAGLGWIGALRTALERVFRSVHRAEHNVVTAKVLDLLGLVVLGLGLVVVVGVGTALTSFAGVITQALGLADLPSIGPLLSVLTVVVGVAMATVLFVGMYRLLPDQKLPMVPLWQGALIAGAGFELLRQLAGLVVRSVTSNVLYGAFATVVALLVWIHYSMQLVVFGASWAVTAKPEPGAEAEDAWRTAPADDER